MNDEQLIKVAIEARELSYSPYSNFKVGAAVLCKDGRISDYGNRFGGVTTVPNRLRKGRWL